MRSRVRLLLSLGLSQNQISDRLGVGKSTVAYHLRRLDRPADDRFAQRYDWNAIRMAYEGGLSRKQCMEKFGFSADAWHKAVLRGAIVPRPVAKPIEEYLVVGRRTSRTHLKARLIGEGLKPNRCEICGISDWLGNPLSLQLHHRNGDGTDNRIENLQLLCGNCHSQTDTYGGRNGHRRKGHLRLVEPPGGDQEDVA
ncbi:MAG TPA: HNH endonuclease [Solirubrobacterales bacterium]|nr:HNH endonuclease [Solirubrobacterales bacterium]